ncbi:MAG TPA: hypothetical protein ENK46_06710 [Flavobacteriia bacterium]|nr:hypothetical protein [Flavobacteriia bacterium]
MRKIKLIWDFRGNEALEIAKHHCVHLEEFAIQEKLEFYQIDSKPLSEFYAIAFIIVDEKDMIMYRDALQPHRGEIAV